MASRNKRQDSLSEPAFIALNAAERSRAKDAAQALHASEASSQLTLVKESKARVYRYADAQGVLYLKAYYSKTLWERAVLALRPCHRLYTLGVGLQQAGVPSPRPVAAWRFRDHQGYGEAFLMEAVPGHTAKDLSLNDLSQTQLPQLFEAYGRLLGKLLGSGFVPVDMVKSNFIVDLETDPVSVAIIDIDNLRWPPWVPEVIVRLCLLKFARRVAENHLTPVDPLKLPTHPRPPTLPAPAPAPARAPTLQLGGDYRHRRDRAYHPARYALGSPHAPGSCPD